MMINRVNRISFSFHSTCPKIFRLCIVWLENASQSECEKSTRLENRMMSGKIDGKASDAEKIHLAIVRSIRFNDFLVEMFLMQLGISDKRVLPDFSLNFQRRKKSCEGHSMQQQRAHWTAVLPSALTPRYLDNKWISACSFSTCDVAEHSMLLVERDFNARSVNLATKPTSYDKFFFFVSTWSFSIFWANIRRHVRLSLLLLQKSGRDDDDWQLKVSRNNQKPF